MFNGMRIVVGLCACSIGVLALSACEQGSTFTDLGQPAASNSSQTGTSDAAVVSDGRKNAARQIIQPSAYLVDLLQRIPADPTQHACYPLGDALLGFNKWPSTLHAGPGYAQVTNADFSTSEYDVIMSLTPWGTTETEYIISVRVPFPRDDCHFSQVEFNLRAVNPRATGHALGAHYELHQADFPSNDADLPRRSLFDLGGSDIALIVQGLEFNFHYLPCDPPVEPAQVVDTTAWMNYLGPTGWVAFMRDNAYQSGRFYALLGALTGAPRALTDTPNPLDDGFFQSVQVRGDQFDLNSEQPSHLTTPPPRCHVCPDFLPLTPTQPYALLDYSNFDVAGAVTPGRGGFVFVMREPAFKDFIPGGFPPKQVVIDPSANPGNPPAAGNMIPPPPSGYDEAALHTAGFINHPGAVDGPVGGPGVHELSVSVFFIHTWAPAHP